MKDNETHLQYWSPSQLFFGLVMCTLFPTNAVGKREHVSCVARPNNGCEGDYSNNESVKDSKVYMHK